MPLYDYECEQCLRHTEKIQKFSDAPLTVCPHCGGKLEKLLTAPAVQFKGGGWYADLYSSSGGGAKKAESSGDSSSSTTSSDSKPASTTSSTSASTPAGGSSSSSGSSSTGAAAAEPWIRDAARRSSARR